MDEDIRQLQHRAYHEGYMAGLSAWHGGREGRDADAACASQLPTSILESVHTALQQP